MYENTAGALCASETDIFSTEDTKVVWQLTWEQCQRFMYVSRKKNIDQKPLNRCSSFW